MVYKRGRIWWYCFIINGRRYRGSTELSNKAAALQVEAEKRLEVARGIQEVTRLSFGDAFSLFLSWAASHVKPKTHQRYQVSGKRLGASLGDLPLNKITARDVESFKGVREKECSGAGVNRDLACLRHLLNWCVHHDYIRKSPFKGVRMLPEGPGMMRILTHEEEALYLSYASQPLKDVAVLMLNTGMRPDEVFHVRGEDVNLEQKYIFIPNGKTKFARRTIPLSQEAFEMLQKRVKPGYLFPHKNDPSKPMTCLRSHRRVLRDIKLKFRLYDLRHTFGSRMAMAGVDLPTLKELMGHSTIAMTMKYVHPTPEHKIAAIEKLTSHNFGHSACPN
jgi:integrase